MTQAISGATTGGILAPGPGGASNGSVSPSGRAGSFGRCRCECERTARGVNRGGRLLDPIPVPLDPAADQTVREAFLPFVPSPVPRPERWALAAVLALAGVVVTATAVPAAFTIDESNYLASLVALRDAQVTMPGTEGLPPTTELLWFDPVDRWRKVESTPVAPLAPPLWAPLALPFSVLGWRGLVGLNTLALLATAALVFAWVRRLVPRREAAWIAVAAFALGAPQLEYAQGVWPHQLAMLLVFA